MDISTLPPFKTGPYLKVVFRFFGQVEKSRDTLDHKLVRLLLRLIKISQRWHYLDLGLIKLNLFKQLSSLLSNNLHLCLMHHMLGTRLLPRNLVPNILLHLCLLHPIILRIHVSLVG